MPTIAVLQTAIDSNETIIWCACFIFVASDGGLFRRFFNFCCIFFHPKGVNTVVQAWYHCATCSYLTLTWRLLDEIPKSTGDVRSYSYTVCPHPKPVKFCFENKANFRFLGSPETRIALDKQ